MCLATYAFANLRPPSTDDSRSSKRSKRPQSPTYWKLLIYSSIESRSVCSDDRIMHDRIRLRRYFTPKSSGSLKCSPEALAMYKTESGRFWSASHICSHVVCCHYPNLKFMCSTDPIRRQAARAFQVVWIVREDGNRGTQVQQKLQSQLPQGRVVHPALPEHDCGVVQEPYTLAFPKL